MLHESNVVEEAFPWQMGVFDAHCHPTDSPPSINSIPLMKASALTIMATRSQDQDVVSRFADTYGVNQVSVARFLDAGTTQTSRQCQIVPAFGWHPWFSHQIYDDSSSVLDERLEGPEKINHYQAVLNPVPDDLEFLDSLPSPRSLSAYILQTRRYLEKHPYALVGEIGLDRTFRVPVQNRRTDDGDPSVRASTPGRREGNRLTKYRVSLDHQRTVFQAQLRLAGEMARAVSVHGVAAHGIVFETLRETWKGHEKSVLSKRAQKKMLNDPDAHSSDEQTDEEEELPINKKAGKPFPPRICLHSYSGSPDLLQQYFHPSIPSAIFFSFSLLVNFSSPSDLKIARVIKAVPDDRLLVESDFHAAGERVDELLEQVVRRICSIKGWSLERGVQRLASNWIHFALGIVQP